MYLDRKFGLNLSLSEITLLFDLSQYLDRTLAQRKAQRKAKSKVKVAHCVSEKKTCRHFNHMRYQKMVSFSTSPVLPLEIVEHKK